MSDRNAAERSVPWLGFVVLVGMIAAGVIAVLSGAPRPLPDVALGSTLLLYAEKAVAFFAVFLLALVILLRAFAGQLPIELRGMKWADMRQVKTETEEAVDALTAATDDLRRRLELLEALEGVDQTS